MSNAAEYSVGDLVELKSGGPTMTVSKATRGALDDRVMTYECQWFDGTKLESGTFSLASLQPANAAKP